MQIKMTGHYCGFLNGFIDYRPGQVLTTPDDLADEAAGQLVERGYAVLAEELVAEADELPEVEEIKEAKEGLTLAEAVIAAHQAPAEAAPMVEPEPEVAVEPQVEEKPKTGKPKRK